MALLIITLVLLLANFPSGSDGSEEARFCSPEKPWLHVSEFPEFVVNALNYVVQNAASSYTNPGVPQKTDVELSYFYPGQTHGSAWAVATCYADVTPGDCTRCLTFALPRVMKCKKNALGGAYVPDVCWLHFGQYMP